jgi:hypothetical protein
MGVVYKARQLRPPRLVALKVVLHGEYAGGDALARFRTEANAAARLQHPNVVAVHEAGTHEDRPFLVLEFVDGGTLADRLTKGPIAIETTARLLRRLAGAVQFAHEHGVLHRDLKPANVLLAATAEAGEIGIPKIADFGLAKPLTADSSLAAGAHTQTGAILGTPSYMAPEQAGGKSAAIGTPADVWALGAILYECLTGQPPFRAGSMVDTLMQVVADDPAPPRRLRPDCPHDLETICLKCLQKDPGLRYASAGALADDLGRFMSGEPIAARPAGRLDRLRRALKQRKEMVYLSAGALAVALVSLLLLEYSRRAKNSSPAPGAAAVAPPAAAALPEDLRLLPAGGSMFFSVRLGDLWAREDVRSLAGGWIRLMMLAGGQGRKSGEFEEKLTEVRQKTGLGVEDVERVTYAMFRGGDPGSFALLVALSKSVELPRLQDLIREEMGDKKVYLPQRRVNGKTVFLMGGGGLGFPRFGFSALTDRLYVLALEPTLGWLAERSDQESRPGPLSPSLTLAALRHAVVLGFNTKTGLTPWGQAPLPVATLLEKVEAITAVVDLPEPGPGQPLTGLSLELIGDCATEDQARQLLELVRAAMPDLVAQIEAEAPSSPAARFLPLLTEPLRAAEYSQEGPRARMRVRWKWKPEDMVQLQRLYFHKARRAQAEMNLRLLGTALSEYVQANNGRLPPAAAYGSDGRPLLSWRVQILPQLGQQELFKQFRLDEPWDGPNNKKLLEKMPEVYDMIPADLDAKPVPGRTVFRALVGPGAAFEGRQGVPLSDFSDGVAQTAVVVTAGPQVEWTRPDELPFDPSRPPARPTGVFSDGFFALFADRSVRFLPASLDEKGWRALITRKAGDKPPAGLIPPPPPKAKEPPGKP